MTTKLFSDQFVANIEFENFFGFEFAKSLIIILALDGVELEGIIAKLYSLRSR